MRKITFTRIILILLILGTFFQQASAVETGKIQIVESIPLEAKIGNQTFPDTVDVWLRMINNARKTLDIEVFYISNKKGQPLEKVISAIEKAADRGVKVRIIIDSKFIGIYPEPARSLGKRKNISFRIINFNKLTGGVMHAKFFIVDGRFVFLGSQNFDWRALNQNHEIGVYIENRKIAREIEKIFNLDWQICVNPKSAGKLLKQKTNEIINRSNPVKIMVDDEEVIVYPAFSPKKLAYSGMSLEEEEIVSLMKSARKEILVQVMTYSPKTYSKKDPYYAVLDNAIRAAAQRGIKVKLLVANWSVGGKKIDFLKSLAQVPNVEVKISSLPEYSKGFIPFARVEHCKYMVVDGRITWIGTGNWEKSYFHACRDMGVVIISRKMSSQMRKMFQTGWNSPYAEAIDLSKKYKRPRIK
ncbi:MAG: hypothetical protein K8T10_18995 [Candidatus Eremiobacteraeota bacterium]|nr:hypothetical protein [Candidatus Eremiobacteraeota bacterium]